MDDEINLRDYINVLKKRWKLIAKISIGLAAFALIISFLQSPIYQARTTLIVRSSSAGSFSSQIGGLMGIFGMGSSGMSSNIEELTNLIQSKAVAAKVLEDLKLKERVENWNHPELSQQKLIKYVQYILSDPEINGNFVELKFEFTDPQLTAEIANGYLKSLSYYWNQLNYTEARKKREYIESQLPGVEKKLKESEKKMKSFSLLSPGMSSSAYRNPGNSGYAGLAMQSVDVARLAREVEIQNVVYTMLRKEYETVKLEESKEIPPFSIIDKPVVPERPSRPRKKLNTVIGLILGLFIGVSVAFFLEYWESTSKIKLKNI